MSSVSIQTSLSLSCEEENPTFWARAMAMGIDLVFLSCLYSSALVMFGLALQRAVFFDINLFVHLSLASLIVFLTMPFTLAACYFFVCHAWGGQTLGKIFMGLRVVSRFGGSLTVGTSFLRLIGYFFSAFPLGAGFLWAVLDKNQEAWHDKLALTTVISSRNFLTRE